jgi:hypothetical protein
MPVSSYTTQEESRLLLQKSTMFGMYKAYGRNGTLPNMLCCEPGEIREVVMDGTQPKGFMWNWRMETMNRMCETITWMALTDKADRGLIQDACVKSLDEWDQVVSSTKMLPMMERVERYLTATLSPEAKEKYWKACYKQYNVIDC